MTEEAAVTEEFVTVDDVVLWTARSGSGYPMVLSHGGPGLNDNLGGLAAMIDDLVTVYRYDQRGCDRSTAGGTPQSVERSIADLEALRRHFGVERWILGGHSWGANLSLFYALRYPEHTAGLLYLDGPGLDPGAAKAGWEIREARLTPQEWDEALYELSRVDDPDPERREYARRRCAHLFWISDFADRANAPDPEVAPLYTVTRDPAIYQAITDDVARRLAEPGFAEAVRACRVPALVVRGAADPIPGELSAHVASVLPEAAYHELVGVGHTPWLEHPERLAAVLRPFLAEVVARQTAPTTR